MESRTIAVEYLETRPRLVADIAAFDNNRGFSLLRALHREDNAINFFSLLAEVHTGLFFDPLCSDLRYNYSLDGKTPDWLITINSQDIVCEVFRLNTPEEECIASIEHSRELRKFQIENPGVPIVEYSEPKTIDTAYLCGAQSKLQHKEAKYRNIIESHRLPYIICVNPSIDTFISEIDLRDFLMGKHGFFATDEHFGANVTGVLLQGYFTGHWVYFHNQGAKFPLTAENSTVISQWQL